MGGSSGDVEEGRHDRELQREKGIRVMDVKSWHWTNGEGNHGEAWDESGFSKKTAGKIFINA